MSAFESDDDMEKKDGIIVIHLPKEKAHKIKRWCERRGTNPSEYGRHLFEKDLDFLKSDYEFMKSIFEDQ